MSSTKDSLRVTTNLKNNNLIKKLKMNYRVIFFIVFALLTLIFHEQVVAAPNICFSSSSRPEDAQYCSPLSLLASKAMGVMVKCASLACQFLPIPEFVKPSKPKLTIGKAQDYCQRNDDFSMEFDD